MTNEQPHLTIIETGGVSIVEFADRKILEELCIAEIQDTLLKLVAETPKIDLLLDFSNVDHLSSSALGTLITLNKAVEEAKGQLKLANITPQIYEVFKITRLNKLFRIYGTKAEALESF